jgi:hypothetical protein
MNKNIQDAVEILRRAGDSVILDAKTLNYETMEIIVHAMYHIQGGHMTKWVWATDEDDAIEQANDNLGYSSLEAAKVRADLMHPTLQIFKVEVTKE